MEKTMPIRFRRSFKILPGVRVNVNKGSISVTVGPRGAHLTFGPHGVVRTIGLPGTGLSDVAYLNKDDSDSEKEKDSDENGRKRKRDADDDDNNAVGCFPGGCLLFILVLAVAGYFVADYYHLIPPDYLSDLLQQLTQWAKRAGL
jgi:hypothetical protein